MRHYCTLFDSKYLAQGLVLYESLKKHSSEEFTLHLLGMDRECQQALHSLNLGWNVQVDRLEVLELGYDLKGIRAKRTWAEYCWTMASIHASHLMPAGVSFESITYLDADLMFFSDPKVIFDEIGDRSIAVIPHRLPQNKDFARLSRNGKFNVSWVTFKNTPTGRECLSRWAAQCRERCSAEIGCGDQGYLDEWPAKYGDQLCVIQNIGAGVAPWNISSYELDQAPLQKTPAAKFEALPIVDGKPVVFYHYHEFKDYQRLTNYKLRPLDVRYLYMPYIDAVNEANKRIQEIRVSA